MTLRVVKGRCHQNGFRVRQVTQVTTLLDPQLYLARDILQAYLRRWRLEMCLDDLKPPSKWTCCEATLPRWFKRNCSFVGSPTT